MTSDITFVITGNQNDLCGNPIGYKRTLNHSWTDEATKYKEWQEYVRGEFISQCKKVGRESILSKLVGVHPIVLGKKEIACVTCDIEFASDGTRADCDNVHKGILDSLFKNDKYVMEGHYKGKLSSDKIGRVTVNIKIMAAMPT